MKRTMPSLFVACALAVLPLFAEFAGVPAENSKPLNGSAATGSNGNITPSVHTLVVSAPAGGRGTVAEAMAGPSPGIALDVPREISLFEPPVIRVTGLRPLEPVTIRVTFADARGVAFLSDARFRPDLDGVVDTTRTIANGHYEGVDPMGPFWSARGQGGFVPPLDGSVRTTIEVEDGEGRVLASALMDRRVVPATVTVTRLRPPATPFVANLYEHSGPARPGVITLTGSNGGIDPRMAPWLVSQGYNVLALGYYHGQDLPEDLIEFPLEYFGGALKWLSKRPSVQDRIGVVGGSKGAEAALLVASYYPHSISAVAAFVPTHVVWEGIDARARFGGDPRFTSPGKSSWSFGGKPLPFVRKFVSPARLAKPTAASLDVFVPALDQPIDPGAWIPVERIRAPVFLVSGGDDQAWPSMRMAREIRNRLAARSGKREVELWEYPMAGHSFAAPGLQVSIGLGGSPAVNAEAGKDAWSRLRAFLRAHIGDPSSPGRLRSSRGLR